MAAITDEKLSPARPQPSAANFGIEDERVPLHAHVAYFWDTEKDFADAVGFLEVGLRGADHCVIFGHDEANQAVCRILRERGFDVEALRAMGRLTELGGNSSGDMILHSIADTFEQALAGGAPLIRLLGNIGWGKHQWPGEQDLFAFEAKVTDAAKQFPCVVVCMYDVPALSGMIVRHGAFETHPFAVHGHSICENPYYVPTGIFLDRIEAIAAEISERRRAEEALRKSEERFRALFESAPIGISINDAEGRFLQVNRSFGEMLGYTEDELRAMSFKEITFADDLAESKRVFGELVEGKRKDFRIEKRYRRKHGALIWANTNCSAVRDAGGKFVYTFAMVEDISERKRDEETLRAIAEGTASVTGSGFFRSLVHHLAHALQVRYAFIAECAEPAKTEVRTLAFWKGDGFGENFAYPLAGTPCAHVLGGEVCCYPERITFLFPEDKDLVTLGAESYLGVPLHDALGNILGHLAVMDNKPMPARPRDVPILKTFAARAGAELERKRAEEALREALYEVEQLKNRLQAENVYLQEEIRTQHNFEQIAGAGAAIQKVFRNVEKVAPTDTTVLITGETGTGKELVARAIHSLSNRKERPLITVNCAALPSGLIESELFGHEKGAFTGATSRKKGRFELADGGTIFLDEIGELPLETQTKLLRVLQEQEFERVGGVQTIKVDVRVIAATNQRLEEAVKLGAFRADLFYRLNIFPIHLPSLHERRDDIPILTNHFVNKFSRRMGKKIDQVSSEALEKLSRYDWPGNVRELANVIERAVILCDGGVLKPEHLSIASAQVTPEDKIPTLEAAERMHILEALKKTKGVVGGANGAAKLLGLNRTTLLARMKRLGIEKK